MERLSDFHYVLPDELIAQHPLPDRAASRLMVLRDQGRTVLHRTFCEAPELLEPGDLLVLNNTRVTAVRIEGHRLGSGGKVELLLLSEQADGRFLALTKPARKLTPGSRVELEGDLNAEIVEAHEEGLRTIQFETNEGWRERLQHIGRVPLPPYIQSELADRERYQTVYASVGGSAAAPTAGLHFTPEIFERLEKRGIRWSFVTLAVSLDTFRPIAIENLDKHVMYGEQCSVSEETALAVKNCKGRVIAVGTTTVRTLETFAVGPRELAPGETVSRLFIRPGHKWQIVEGIFTNFHLPETTMLVMLSAKVPREHLLAAYAEAVNTRYRFLSFGDSMLIL